MSATTYPCDRGIAGNVTARGWHHFEASPNGVICCRYCGQKPSATTTPREDEHHA